MYKYNKKTMQLHKKNRFVQELLIKNKNTGTFI